MSASGGLRGAVGGGEQAPVQVEAGDGGQGLAGDLVDWHPVGDVVLGEEGVEFGRETHEAAHREPGLQQAADDEGALRDDQPPVGGVRAVEVADVVEPGVGGVVDPDAGGVHRGSQPMAFMIGSMPKKTTNRAETSHMIQWTSFARPAATAMTEKAMKPTPMPLAME